MTVQLLAGAAEVEITPPVGTPLCGSLAPRTSKGVLDPLMVKALVLESGTTRLAYAIFDLCVLGRDVGDQAVTRASESTGIPPDHIIWTASHTHSGPYTTALVSQEGVIDHAWLGTLPDALARCVAEADAAKVPARVSRVRGYHYGLGHNRRLQFKDGREINTWLLNAGEEEVQCLGAAGPIDPEVGALAFETLDGRMLAVLFHYALHTNAYFGERLSADYPAVVASRLRECYGPQTITLFLPGAQADINSIAPSYRHIGDALASEIESQLRTRRPTSEPITLGALKREVTVPYRDCTVDQTARIQASQWSPESQETFHRELEIMRQAGVTETKTILQTWRVSNVGFASLPGELFVQWGMKIKRESPFPWTYPVELGGDYLGYLVTQQAWEAGGYESLIARSAKPSIEGVGMMVDTALDMLHELYRGDIP